MGNYTFTPKKSFNSLLEFVGLKNREFRVVMYGLDAAGKTTILYKYVLGTSVTTIPTIGFNVEKYTHKNITITLWDLGLRDKARPLIRHYLPNTDALIMVIDSNDRERINEFKDELYKLIDYDEIKNGILLLIANKQDLPNAMSIEELQEKLELNKIRKVMRAVNIIKTCATSGEGIHECFEWISDALTMKNIQQPFHETFNDAKNLTNSVGIKYYINNIQKNFWYLIGYKSIDNNLTTV